MAIEVKEIVRRYRYNGVTLPDVAGMSPKEIRDLYSAQYPELVSAEIDTGEIVDMVKAGIIDPAKVTRSALQNAASIAKNILTTEAIVAEPPEKTPAGAGAGMPDMGGMM